MRRMTRPAILEVHYGCIRGVLGVYRACFRSVLGGYWGCIWGVLRVYCGYLPGRTSSCGLLNFLRSMMASGLGRMS